MGLWATPYVPSPNGASPISIRTTEYEMDRYRRCSASVDFTIGSQNLNVGGWYENNKFNQARRFYALASRTEPGLSFRDYPKNPFFTQWEFDFTTDTLQYLCRTRSTWHGDDQPGVEGLPVTNEAEAVFSASFPQGKIKAQDWFQPHRRFRLEGQPRRRSLCRLQPVDPRLCHRPPPPAPSRPTRPGSTRSGIIAETRKSDTYELGLRYNTPTSSSGAGCLPGQLPQPPAGGAGRIGDPGQSLGAAERRRRPRRRRRSGGQSEARRRLQLSTLSYSYTDATYRDDVLNGNGDLSRRSRARPWSTAPSIWLRGEFNFDDGQRFFRVGLNYMSRRYYSYTNDASVPGRLIVDASLGYRFTDKVEVQLNATNLFDKRYVGTIGSGGFGNSGDAQTLLVGAPQQFFATLKAGF
jgi:iron complex outermembrane receptor protein